jgi:hypothetical protein
MHTLPKTSLLSLTAALLLAAYGLTACGKKDAASSPAKEHFALSNQSDAPPLVADQTRDADGSRQEAKRPGGTGGMPGPVDERKIIRTGLVRVHIDAYDPARARIEELVLASGGFIASASVEHREGQVSEATLVLRIPSHAYGNVMAQIGTLGQVTEEQSNAQDVTEEFVDLTARLNNARKLEARLIEMIAGKTSTVADLLEVERELSRVRGEIEQAEGRLRLLEHQSALSTLTVQLTTRAPEIAAAPPPTLGGKIEAQWNSSIGGMKDLGDGILLTGVAIAPWLPLILLGGWITWRRRRWFGLRQQRPLVNQ